MRNSILRRAAVAAVTIGFTAAGLVPAGAAGAAEPWERAPTADEVALLVLTNQARAQRRTKPLVWNHDLGAAARFHSWDMATNGCWGHDSCDGESWGQRLARFYDGSASENIGGGGTPAIMHAAWMSSPGHRANLLRKDWKEFGAAIEISATRTSYATENFGYRSPERTPPIPAIPAAAVLFPPGWGSPAPVWEWPLVLNFYDKKPPRAVEAVVDGQPIALKRVTGTATNGTWQKLYPTSAYPTGCREVYFRVTKRDGSTERFPQSGAFGLGLPDGCRNRPIDIARWEPPPPLPPPPPTEAPDVFIDSPAHGQRVNGIIEIRAHATDDKGVTAMELYIDYRRVLRRTNVSSITKSWNTTLIPPGDHIVSVVAYDADENAAGLNVLAIR